MTPAASPERSEQIRTLFREVVDLAPEQRAAHLAPLRGIDPDLRGEVEALLEAHDRGNTRLDQLDRHLSWLPDLLAEAENPLAGRQISHFQILEKLGGGGMGVVYKARDLKLERTVALKFLPPHLSLDEGAKQRFIQEAKAASALDHPNICTIHEIGETDEGQLFLAMSCYPGETLKKKIERGPLPVVEALDYAAQVAEGLQRAHEAGIVHRDIKPANVLVTERGQVKLLDFGIAKMQGENLTSTGVTLGTVAYMSPEQARGEAVDHRTDLWSLGVVLYEMLTGVRPFRGDAEAAVVYGIRNDEPPLLERLRPEVPLELARVVHRCLSKDPAARYASAAALLADLRSVTRVSTEGETRAGEEYEQRSLSRATLATELKRRSVFRVGAVYAAVGFVLLQAADLIFPALLLPEWAFRLMAVFVILGFPLALVLAWAFELTPEGVRRTQPAERYQDGAEPMTDPRSRRAAHAVPTGPAEHSLRLAWKWRVWGGVAALLFVVGMPGMLLWRQAPSPQEAFTVAASETLPRLSSLAVLPLKNYSGDPAQEFFADGMTEELITTLTKIEGLRVIAHRSVLQFKHSEQSVPEIARLLEVRYVVDGSVMQDAERVRFTANLIDAATNMPVWGERFERERRDVLVLQREVALAIARQIELTLTPQDRARLAATAPVDPEAFELYVRGTQARYRQSIGFSEAMGYFEQAIARDSSYAPAYAAIAWIHAYLGNRAGARQFVQRALELDPDLAETYVALGLMREHLAWDWEGAEEAFRQAIRLNPGYAEAHHELSMLLMRLRRFDEALREAQYTLYLAPTSARFQSGLGEVHLYAGRYEEAVATIEKAIALDPNARPHIWLALAYGGQQRYDLAMEAVAKAPNRHLSGCFYPRAYLGYLHAVTGHPAAAREVLQALTEELRKDDRGITSCAYSMAVVYVGLGEHGRALELLEQHASPDHLWWGYLAIEPTFRPLHAEPRFQALLKKVGLE